MMQRTLLIAIGVLSVGTAIYMWTSTQHWYDNVPGVSATGPLNVHFVKDVALAYLASGAALLWAGLKRDKTAGICGASWLVFHALFHIWIWLHRGLPVDIIAVSNLFGIQFPAFVAVFAAIKLQTRGLQS
ncbi:MAG: hypothetical protein ABJL99_04855 [Aliishimia sp.]